MTQETMLWLLGSLCVIVSLELLYLRSKFGGLASDVSCEPVKCEPVSAGQRTEIIKRASKAAMEGVAEQNRKEVGEYVRNLDIKHDGCFTSSASELIDSKKYKDDVDKARKCFYTRKYKCLDMPPHTEYRKGSLIDEKC